MITKSWVRGFRNLRDVFIDAGTASHIGIFGENNHGKTNILESLYFALNGQGLDQHDAKVMVETGKQNSFIQLLFSHHDENHVVDVSLTPDGKKRLVLDKKGCRSFKQLHRFLIGQYISVETIRVFKDSAEARRKDLDRFCGYFRPSYARLLSQYERLLRQRNKWLKQPEWEGKPDIWAPQLVQLATQIVKERFDVMAPLLQKLIVLAQRLELVSLDRLSINYVCKGMTQNGFDADQYAQQLTDKLAEQLPKDRRIGYTSVGPQRDDIHILNNGQWLVQYASRGINQIVAILWKVAQVQLLLAQQPATHVMLLDDAFAELDEVNRVRLMTLLTSYTQVIYVTAQVSNRTLLPNSQWFHVQHGALTVLQLND